MFELSNIVKINLWTIVFELTSFVHNSENNRWNLAQQFELTDIFDFFYEPFFESTYFVEISWNLTQLPQFSVIVKLLDPEGYLSLNRRNSYQITTNSFPQ